MISPIAMIGMICTLAALGASLLLLRRLGAHDMAASIFAVIVLAFAAAIAGALIN